MTNSNFFCLDSQAFVQCITKAKIMSRCAPTLLLGLFLIKAPPLLANVSANGDFVLYQNQSPLFNFQAPGNYSQTGTLEPGNTYDLIWSSNVNAQASTIGASQEFGAYASFVNLTLGTPVANSLVQRSATAEAGGIPGQPNPNFGQSDHLFSPDFNFSESLAISGGGQTASTISNVRASFTLSQGLPVAFGAQGALQVATSSNGMNIGAGGSGSYVFDWTFTVNAPTPYSASAIIPIMAKSETTVTTGGSSAVTYNFVDVPTDDWVDPQLAKAYVYQMSGGSFFTQILNFPTGFAAKFNVLVNGVDLGAFGPGDQVDFVKLLGKGVSSFEITGIDPGVDPSSSVAFPVQLVFDTPTASFTMTVGVTDPIANAGPSQTAQVGTLVTLDGSASSDPNNFVPLTYAWSFVSKPVGSTVVLSNSSIVNPTFTPDAVGDYLIQLIVTDAAGFFSPPATVSVSTVASPPVADAGPDQSVTVIGTVVQLNGSQSYSPAGLAITYQWSILAKPVGSNATLTAPTTATPSFVADLHGNYSIQLIVTDSLGTASGPAIVNVTSNNVAPIANAGLSESAVVGQTVTLNGSGSNDPDGDPLTYKWSLASAPSASQAVISNPNAQVASFVPDLPGTFVAQLIVNDGLVDSPPATAQIQVVTLQTRAIQNIQSLQQNIIAKLAPGAFKNANMQNALLNKLNSVLASIEAGNYSDALGQLQNDILGKTDGCANSGAPDKNDWIIDCPDQSKVYTPLLNIIAEVKALCGC
jgi:hypothetical protein